MTNAPLTRALLALAATTVLSACSSSSEELEVEGLAPGACTEAAPALQDVDETLRQVEEGDLTPEEAATRMRDAQGTLNPLRQDAEQPVAGAIRELITQAGFFRISVDSNSYDGSQVQDVRTALDDLVQECRGG